MTPPKPKGLKKVAQALTHLGEGWTGALALVVAIATTLFSVWGIKADVDTLVPKVNRIRADVRANDRELRAQNRVQVQLRRTLESQEAQIERQARQIDGLDAELDRIEERIEQAIQRAFRKGLRAP